MKESIDNGNARVSDSGDVTQIVIPSKKNILIILFMSAWLGGWFLGESTVLAILLGGGFQPFLLFWIAGWTVGGCFAICVLSWMLFGREVISIDGETLSIEKRLLGLKMKKEFDVHNVSNIRAIELDTSLFARRRGLEFYGLSGGKIQFDYGMKTIDFGMNIDSAEANHLVERYFSAYKRQNIN